MEDKLEEFEQEEILLSDKDIFTKIWLSPRKVIKYINDKNYSEFVTVLLIFYGITSALNRAAEKNMGDAMPLIGVLIACMIGGGIFGWLSVYIYAALLSWTGKWFKGQGNTKSIFRMMSYSLIPMLVVLFFFIIRIILFGNEVFQSSFDLSERGMLVYSAYMFFVFVDLTIGVWTIVIMVIGLSEVQKLPIGKSILNLILPWLMFIAVLLPLGAIAYIAGDFMK